VIGGDGYGDVVVVEPNLQQALVYFGSPTGLRATPSPPITLDTAMPPNVPDGYVYGLSSGDVNGDGYSDVAIGETWLDSNHLTGSADVRIFLGGPGGLSTMPAATLLGGGQLAAYGASVAFLDANGDGYADLVVGEPGTAISTPCSVQYYQSRGATGIADGANSTSGFIGGAGTRFGISVADAGDLNGDGFHDLIAGADFASSVGFLSGGRTGLVTTSPSNGVRYPGPTGAPFSAFGRSVVGLGDLNGDGFSDVLIGAPEADDSLCATQGVFAYAGQNAFAPTLSAILNTTICGPTGSTAFGVSVAVRESFRKWLRWL
jgi:hypothetical protein